MFAGKYQKVYENKNKQLQFVCVCEQPHKQSSIPGYNHYHCIAYLKSRYNTISLKLAYIDGYIKPYNETHPHQVCYLYILKNIYIFCTPNIQSENDPFERLVRYLDYVLKGVSATQCLSMAEAEHRLWFQGRVPHSPIIDTYTAVQAVLLWRAGYKRNKIYEIIRIRDRNPENNQNDANNQIDLKNDDEDDDSETNHNIDDNHNAANNHNVVNNQNDDNTDNDVKNHFQSHTDNNHNHNVNNHNHNHNVNNPLICRKFLFTTFGKIKFGV